MTLQNIAQGAGLGAAGGAVAGLALWGPVGLGIGALTGAAAGAVGTSVAHVVNPQARAGSLAHKIAAFAAATFANVGTTMFMTGLGFATASTFVALSSLVGLTIAVGALAVTGVSLGIFRQAA